LVKEDIPEKPKPKPAPKVEREPYINIDRWQRNSQRIFGRGR
jgi:hypothetical protein